MVNANVISEEIAKDISIYYNQKKSEPNNRLFVLFGILGAALVGLGIILIIAHNWYDLAKVEFMSVSNKWLDGRIKGLLPPEAKLVHKTGLSRTYDGLTWATNDAGIVTLPDGNHLAITVFVSDSYDPKKKREVTIAKAAKAAYDYWTNTEK
ncbi:MAG: DUF2157 domain-containing protein [Fulvivirga sp.]